MIEMWWKMLDWDYTFAMHKSDEKSDAVRILCGDECNANINNNNNNTHIYTTNFNI